MDALAMAAAAVGIGVGAVVALVPGVPGAVVAWVGLLACAAMTDGSVPPGALAFGATIALVGALGKWFGPVAGARALGGSAGTATGALLGALLGVWIPLPGASWALATVGAAIVGGFGAVRAPVGWARGVAGSASGCLVGIAIDELAVLGVAAVLALCDYQYADSYAQ